MKIGPFGIVEIIIILAVVLIIFGPKNLPKLGTAVGKAVKNLREGIGGGKKVDGKKDAAEKPAEPAAEASAAAQPEEKVAEVVEVIEKPEPGAKSKASQSDAE